MKKIFYGIFILSFLLTACVNNKNTPPIETYSFSPTTPQTSFVSSTTTVLRMMPATISAQFSNYSFIYRTSSMQYLTDPYRQFLTAPNTEVTIYLENKLAPLLHASLISSDNLSAANFILQQNINALYADYQNKSAPEAVVEIQFILYQCESSGPKQIGTITLMEKTNIKPNDPASLLEGYQTDLDKIAEKLGVFLNNRINQ